MEERERKGCFVVPGLFSEAAATSGGKSLGKLYAVLVHVKRDIRRVGETQKIKAADVGSPKQFSLDAGSAANSPGRVGCCMQPAAGLLPGEPGHAGGVCPVMLCSSPQCPAAPARRAISRELYVCTQFPCVLPPTTFGFIKSLHLNFWLPQDPEAWFWGAETHQQPSGPLAGRGKGEQSCFAFFRNTCVSKEEGRHKSQYLSGHLG